MRGAIGPNGRLPVLLPPRGAEDFAATALSASSGAVRGSRTVYVKPENLIADVLDGASRDGASKKRTSPIAQRVAKAAERAEASFLDNLSAGDSKRGGVTAAAPAASKTQRKEKKGAARASSSADAKAAADPAAMLEDEQAAGENGSEAGAGERFQWWFEYLNRLRDVAESVRPPDPTPQQLAAGRKAVRVLRERPAALRSLNTAPAPRNSQPEASTDRTAGVAGGSRAPKGTAFARERDIAPDAGAGGVRAAEAGVREALPAVRSAMEQDGFRINSVQTLSVWLAPRPALQRPVVLRAKHCGGSKNSARRRTSRRECCTVSAKPRLR